MSVSGKTIVITGASSGLGREAAIALAGEGAQLAVVGRNRQRTDAVAAETGGTAFLADFDRLEQVRRLAGELGERYGRIDVLVNNAGGHVPKRQLSADGFERTLQSNHLAPFLLTTLLLPTLIDSGARVISTASAGNNFGHIRLDDLGFEKRPWLGGWPAYGTGKLMNIVFIRELARRTAGSGLEAFSFHPGLVTTGFGAQSRTVAFANAVLPGGYGMSAKAGAAPLVALASARSVGQPSGTYFDRFTPNGRMNRQAKADELAGELWRHTEGLLAPWISPL